MLLQNIVFFSFKTKKILMPKLEDLLVSIFRPKEIPQ